MAYRYEKNYAGGTDIVIDGWEKGIAPSPHFGIADIRGINVTDIPGVAKPLGTTRTNYVVPTYTSTFTADNTTDIITLVFSPICNYYAVTFTSTGSLPTGISAGTIYYIFLVSGSTYKIATTIQNAVAGTAVNFTSNGSGTLTATGVVMGRLIASATQWYSKDYSGTSSSSLFAVDSNGRLWGLSYAIKGYWHLITGAGGTAAVNGVATFQNWLFLFRGNTIDVYGKLTDAITSHAWYNNWKTLKSLSTYQPIISRKTIIGQDSTLYWTDFNDDPTTTRRGYIGSLKEVSGQTLFADTGNPSTSNSTTNYTFNNGALDLPPGEHPCGLAEVNTKLIIATSVFDQYTTNSDDMSKLYTWDRVSSSFDFPLKVPVPAIQNIQNVNNIVYIFGSARGKVYKTDLSSVVEAFRIPQQIYTKNDTTSSYYEGDFVASYTGTSNLGGYARDGVGFSYSSAVYGSKIYFATNFISGTGVYVYDTSLNVLTIEYQPSTGPGTDLNNQTNIYHIVPMPQFSGYTPDIMFLTFNSYLISGVTYHTVDNVYLLDNSTTGYGNYIISDMMILGSNNNKKTISQIEYQLDKPHSANASLNPTGIRLSYRQSIGQSWTTIATDDYATNGAITGRVIDLSITDITTLQIKVSLNWDTRLKRIILR